MIKQQVKINFHLGEWILKPIYVKNFENPEKSMKITQLSFLFFTFRNIRYNLDVTVNPKKK